MDVNFTQDVRNSLITEAQSLDLEVDATVNLAD
jgi:hypothetical protein